MNLKRTAVIASAAVFLLSFQSVYGAGQKAEELARADKLFLQRSDLIKAREAHRIYENLHASEPQDPEIAWRLSMASYFCGFEINKTGAEKKKLFAQGREAGLASLKINPASAEAHFWTAVNMALYGQTVGVIKMLFTLGTVTGHLEKSIELDPVYAYGGAYRILGKVNQELPGILGGSDEKARQFYEKAITAAPDEPMNYLFLALLQENEFKDGKAALQTAEKGLSQDPPDKSRHESLWGLKELQELKARLDEGK